MADETIAKASHVARGVTKKLVALEDIFGEQTSTAIDVLDAMDTACLKATSTGEIQRLQRLGRAKLKMLRNNGYMRDNA